MEAVLRAALKEQFHAGLAMLASGVEACPDDLWLAGEHPRATWRIALHAVFFTHLQLVQNEAAYQPWPERPDRHGAMWTDPAHLEPFELPPDAEPLSPAEVLAYIAFVDGIVDPTLDALDLRSPDSGFRWYADFGKLSHVLMNLRHLQGHVGQLSERAMARGIDIDWIGKGNREVWRAWERANP